MDFAVHGRPSFLTMIEKPLHGSNSSLPLKPANSYPKLSASRNSSHASVQDAVKSKQTDEQETDQTIRKFSHATWIRLRDTARELSRSREEATSLLERLEHDPGILAGICNRDMAAAKRNVEIRLSLVQKKVDKMRLRVTNKRMGRCDITLQMNDKELRLNNIKTQITECEDRTRDLEEERNTLTKHRTLFSTLLRHRQRQMITDLMDIYTIDKIMSDNMKCGCRVVMSICGIHLPPTTSLPGHDDQSISAGLGLVCHLLKALGIICGFSFRYKPIACGSQSAIVNSDGTRISLAAFSRYKSERARLDDGVLLLSRNIAQLRSDCGLHTAKMERTLAILEEILRILAGGQSELIPGFDRPWTVPYSVASLMDPPEGGPRNQAILPCLNRTLTVDTPIADIDLSSIEASEIDLRTDL